jgi:hypothetical protein
VVRRRIRKFYDDVQAIRAEELLGVDYEGNFSILVNQLARSIERMYAGSKNK